MKTAIATTTINQLTPFLTEYAKNVKEYGHEGDVSIYIAGDRKSPACCEDEAKQFQDEGVVVRFLSMDWQQRYLMRFQELREIIPEDSDNRRNVAFLLALEEGADIVISVDDDNYPDQRFDFVGEHSVVTKTASAPEAIGKDNWFNLCSLLDVTEPSFPRGFPYRHRETACDLLSEPISSRIAMNVGLWLGDPDVDAITRLAIGPRVHRWAGKSVNLGMGSFTPINTQNTAISRDAMTAYYYALMGQETKGLRIDRYGDILSGYFAQLCVKAVGEGIRIGSPLVDHRRNRHDPFVDLYQELAGMMILEDLIEMFNTIELPGTSIYDAYVSLSHQLEAFTARQSGFVWDDQTKAFFRRIGSNMRLWADIVREIQ